MARRNHGLAATLFPNMFAYTSPNRAHAIAAERFSPAVVSSRTAADRNATARSASPIAMASSASRTNSGGSPTPSVGMPSTAMMVLIAHTSGSYPRLTMATP